MSFLKIFCLLVFTMFVRLAGAQSFDNPLHTTPLFLSGTFAELRSNHFHSGIDIKTDGVEGKPVYAVENGYISRIAISPWGFGKVIYITHPNGYTTVYAHLSRFRDDIENYVIAEQKRLRKNEINLYPSKNLFPVNRGQQIAWSGNSGSSGGPHLHFEIRKNTNEHPINPLRFSFPVTDNLPPKLLSLEVIDINNHRSFYNIRLKSKQATSAYYTIPHGIAVSSPVRFALESYDYLNGSSNKCGLNTLTLLVDSTPVFEFCLNEVAYNEMRYINSLVDYPVYRQTGKRYQRLFRQPGNNASFYSINKHDGIITLNDTNKHLITIIAKDSYHNTSTLNFFIKKAKNVSPTVSRKVYSYQEEHTVWGPHFSLHLPALALYENTAIVRNELPPPNNNYISPIYQIGDDTIPLHKKAELKFQLNYPNPVLRSKICLVRIDHYGNKKKEKLIYTNGYYKDGYFFAKTRYLGYFSFMLDTVAPVIKPLYLTPRADMYGRPEIVFKVTDNLSGIGQYNLYIDNHWYPVFFDGKKNRMICTFDSSVKHGKHRIRFVVSDSRDNIQTYTGTFFY